MTSKDRTARSIRGGSARNSTICAQRASRFTRRTVRACGARIVTRAALLAELFNAAPLSIGVAGTSGKSTTTAMIAWILAREGRDPTVMNGAVMKNFAGPGALFASALVGKGGAFVSELDESDGSIAMFNATVAALNNIALDHKSMDELRALFGDYVRRAKTPALNLDNAEVALIAGETPGALTCALASPSARFSARDIAPQPFGVSFVALDREAGAAAPVRLAMPGRHNVSNALMAIACAVAAGVAFEAAASALSEFSGVKRRMDVVGEAGGVTVIDDFAHNPDKIAATLSTLHEFDGRLLILFQPHGFGPLNKMKNEFIDCFAEQLSTEDALIMPEPVYFGGTVDRSTTSADIVAGVAARGRQAEAFATREACGDRLIALARPGDRIVVMGARDDTLSGFAADLLRRLG